MQVSIKAIDIQNLYFEMRLFGVRPRSYFILLRQKFINSANAVCKSIYHFNAWRRRWWKGCSQKRQFVSKTCIATICQYKVSSFKWKGCCEKRQLVSNIYCKKDKVSNCQVDQPTLGSQFEKLTCFQLSQTWFVGDIFSRIAYIFRSLRQNWYTWVKLTLLTLKLLLIPASAARAVN